jgi:hypothetical protein
MACEVAFLLPIKVSLQFSVSKTIRPGMNSGVYLAFRYDSISMTIVAPTYSNTLSSEWSWQSVQRRRIYTYSLLCHFSAFTGDDSCAKYTHYCDVCIHYCNTPTFTIRWATGHDSRPSILVLNMLYYVTATLCSIQWTPPGLHSMQPSLKPSITCSKPPHAQSSQPYGFIRNLYWKWPSEYGNRAHFTEVGVN